MTKWLIRLFLIELFNLIMQYTDEWKKNKKERETNAKKIDAYRNAKSLDEAVSAFNDMP